MKILLIYLSLLALTFASDFDNEWKDFKKQFNKKYNETNGEDEFYKGMYRNSRKFVDYYNQMYDEKKISFTTKINKYADLSSAEFSMMGGLRTMTKQELEEFMKQIDKSAKTKLRGRKPPPYINWAERNALPAIQDQDTSATCYAFTTVAAIESHNYIQNGVLHKLSEQQIVDCSGDYGNQGIWGGLMTSSYDYYIEESHGAMLDGDYKYTKTKDNCSYDGTKAVVKLARYRSLPPGNEDLMKDIVGLVGPIATGMDTSPVSFQFYSGGIYDDPKCKSATNSHAVVIVGYGVANGTDYWIIRNSMSESWGMNGYGLIKRGQNFCGIANMPSYPIIDKKETTE